MVVQLQLCLDSISFDFEFDVFLYFNSSDIHPSWYTNSPNTVSVKSTAKRSVEDSDEDDCLLKVIY